MRTQNASSMNILLAPYFLNLLVTAQISLDDLRPEIILPLFAIAGVFFLILGITGGVSIFGKFKYL